MNYWLQLLGLNQKALKDLIAESPIKTVGFLSHKYRKNTRYVRECLAGPDPTPEEIARLPRACQICGRADTLELDHIRPLCRGGMNEISNRRWLCRTCNRRQPKARYQEKA